MKTSPNKAPAIAVPRLACPKKNIKKSRPTILMVVHEASRTGAPIIAWNLIVRFRRKFNVVTILLGGGVIESALSLASTEIIKIPIEVASQPDAATRFLKRIIAIYGPQYAIANSAATHGVATILADINVPVIALVNEFSRDFRPIGCLHELYLKAARIVFPSRLVAESSQSEYVVLRRRRFEIVPHGPMTLPDPNRKKSFGSRKPRVSSHVRMDRYVGFLQKLGQSCLRDSKQDARDLQVILKAGVFDARLCFGAVSVGQSLVAAVERYLRQSRLAQPRYQAGSYVFSRRPVAGFNPLIYASDCPEFRSTHQNPLAHFLRSGKPPGRWLHDVIVPTAQVKRAAPMVLRVALHGHFHYPELLPQFLERLRVNQAEVDLFLTTTTKERAIEIERILATFSMTDVNVAVTLNVGRDIAPFLRMFRDKEGTCDVIGHLHGKMSPHRAPGAGDRWRELAFELLLGGAYPMADIILQRFADDPGLGLVFHEDPDLNDWDGNRELGEVLAKRMKIPRPLPAFFDFPIGTMFWARPQALKPIFDLGLSEKDFPPEPLPTDGTVVHALERLMTFAAEKAGFSYATTYVPGCWR